MKSVLYVVLLTSVFNAAIASDQTKENVYEGEIELKSNETKQGKFAINYDSEVVTFFNNDGTVDAYSAYQISSIFFYDDFISQPRVFVSMQISPENRKGGNYLYELVKVGTMDILRRPEKNLNTNKIATLPLGPRVHQFDKKFEYYIFYKGDLISMKNFMSSVFPILNKEMEADLNNYAKRRNLNLNDKLQPLILIEYFNAVSKNSLKFAKASVE